MPKSKKVADKTKKVDSDTPEKLVDPEEELDLEEVDSEKSSTQSDKKTEKAKIADSENVALTNPVFSKQAILAGIIVVIAVLVGVLLMVANNFTAFDNSPEVVETDDGIQIDFEVLEIANENNERQRGFMFREEICDNCGMLFVFPDELDMSFWMKDTPVSLDIIFMDESGEIIKIHENAEPDNTEKRYPSEGYAKYVLEAKAGFVDRVGLEEGEQVDIDYLRDQGINFVWISIG